jgi:hypothetical protein
MTKAHHSKGDYSSVSLTSDELTEHLLGVFERGHQLLRVLTIDAIWKPLTTRRPDRPAHYG